MNIPTAHDIIEKDDSTRVGGIGNLSTVGDILRPVGYQMIRSIAVKNFRSFRDVSLDDLRAINILVGESASGKTALLEAIRLALGGTPSVAWTMNALRGLIAFMPPNPPREQFEAAWVHCFLILILLKR
ncbi:MAG: AAA family ATPase [Methylocella sp.]